MRLFRKTGERLGPAAAMRIFDEVDHMVVETLEGQAMELGWVRDNDLTVGADDYLRLVLKKTAWYSFIHPMRIGALVANGDDQNLGRFDRFGYLLGLAFQITDDVLNLNGRRCAIRQGDRRRSLGRQTDPSADARARPANRTDRAWIEQLSGAAARAPPAARGAAAPSDYREQRRHRVGAAGGSRICGSRGARVRQLGFRGCACKSRPGVAARLRGLPITQGRHSGRCRRRVCVAQYSVDFSSFEYRQRGAAMPAVREWLVSLGLSEYADSFAEHRIDSFDPAGPDGPGSQGPWRRALAIAGGLLRAIAELAEAASAAPSLRLGSKRAEGTKPNAAKSR